MLFQLAAVGCTIGEGGGPISLLGVLCLPLVGDLRHIARVPVDSVVNFLEAAVRQLHIVEALGVVALSCLLLAEVVAGGCVADGPAEVIVGRGARLVVGVRGGGWNHEGGGEAQEKDELLVCRGKT